MLFRPQTRQFRARARQDYHLLISSQYIDMSFLPPVLRQAQKELEKRFPEFRRAHREDYVVDGELLPSVMLENLCQFLKDLYELPVERHAPKVVYIANLLERLAILRNKDIDNVLSTTILENLEALGEHRRDFLTVLGPNVRRLIRDMHDESQHSLTIADPLADLDEAFVRKFLAENEKR